VGPVRVQSAAHVIQEARVDPKRTLVVCAVLTLPPLSQEPLRTEPPPLLAQKVARTELAADSPPPVRQITIGDSVRIHYVELGKGVPVVFVHGSLSDYTYWQFQVPAFAHVGYRAITYSRRHNSPNSNPARPGYSAVVDAEDLAALIDGLHLGRVHVVGHSYGALTALFLAARHPQMVRTVVLAEAPAVGLLEHLPDERAERDRTVAADIRHRMVEPMKEAFSRGDRDTGLRAFLGYVSGDPLAWDRMPGLAREETLRNAAEWDAMLTTGELFPALEPDAVRTINAPALLLSGGKSYPFLALIDEELARLLPRCRRVVFPEATHQMWFDEPERCRESVLAFWRAAA
jgi:non-heme chloroperoxidase